MQSCCDIKKSTTTSIGLIAGSGDFPVLVAQSAKAQGMGVVAIGFKSQTAPRLERYVDSLEYVGLGQLGKLIKTFKRSKIEHVVMAGKLQHKLIFGDLRFDAKMVGLVARLKDRRAASILGAIAEEMEKEGITLLDSTSLLKKDLVGEGHLAGPKPSPAQRRDIAFGHKVAWELARLDIGQTVAIKDRAVVAVEGFEGTDAMMVRAGELAGKGVVIVKVSRPHQDMRFDVPVIGETTLQTMAQAGAKVLAVASGKTLILDQEAFLAEAKHRGIGVIGLPFLPGETS